MNIFLSFLLIFLLIHYLTVSFGKQTILKMSNLTKFSTLDYGSGEFSKKSLCPCVSVSLFSSVKDISHIALF